MGVYQGIQNSKNVLETFQEHMEVQGRILGLILSDRSIEALFFYISREGGGGDCIEKLNI